MFSPAETRSLERGEAQCGCIHGAAYLAGGEEKCFAFVDELLEAGIGTNGFDNFAREEIAQDFCVTVESTLSHFNVSVREGPSDG